jgi:hypothetical protein
MKAPRFILGVNPQLKVGGFPCALKNIRFFPLLQQR